MNTTNLSSRNRNKTACKEKYNHFFIELDNLVGRFRGGVKTLSYSTSVTPSTLSNGVNPHRNTDTITLQTFLDILSATKDVHFADYFSRAFLKQTHEDEQEASFSDVLSLVSSKSMLINAVTSALSDGELSTEEKQEIIDLLLQNNDENTRMITKLRAGAE